MKKEIWKDIHNYEGLYQVSNLGRVRSLGFRNGCVNDIVILKQYKDIHGYFRVSLCKDGKHKWFRVHRLVWETFNGEIPKGMQVNHINEDKTDNRYPENLNLMSPKENTNYGTRNKRISEKMTNGKQSRPVLQLTYPGLQFICEYPSLSEAGRNGFNTGHVNNCCRGRYKSHKGFTFRYK